MPDQPEPSRAEPRFDIDRSTAQLFSQLAELTYAADDFAEVYRSLVEVAPQVVLGCDHASMMVRRGDRIETAIASDAVGELLDKLEQEVREGPCLEALEADKPDVAYWDADIASETSWPKLAQRTLTETPVRGMAGFRLHVGPERQGSLNLFSDRTGALTEECVHRGMVLASFLSVALAAEQERRSAETLREGLRSNREIGKAIGLLMAFHRVDDQQAFEMLRSTSQDLNIKLKDVARQVVEHHRGGQRG